MDKFRAAIKAAAYSLAAAYGSASAIKALREVADEIENDLWKN